LNVNVNSLPGVDYYPERDPEPERGPAGGRGQRGSRPGGLTTGRVLAIFVAVLAAGIAIRLWRLGVSPGPVA